MQGSTDRLALLYRISQTFNSTLDLAEVLDRVMDEVIAAVHAERGFLMLVDADGHLAFRAARGLEQHTIQAPEFQVSRGVVERVASQGVPLLTSDAQLDARLGGRASIVGLGLHSILCVPLQLKGQTRGVLYLDNRLQAGIFRPDDLDLLTAIAASAAIAIENARLYQIAVEKGRMERELQLARSVQASLLPREAPVLPGYELAAWWQPAREVSGDFYDFVPLAGDRAARDGQGILIGDVSDKGMPAALFMALTRSTLRACLTQSPQPAEAIAHANRLVCMDSADGTFVTLFYVWLEPSSGRLSYVNAGHNPPLLYRADQGCWLELGRTGMVLGFDEAAAYGEGAVVMRTGDCLVLYTDGATDAEDAAGEAFGEERLRAALEAARDRSAAEAVAALQAAVVVHTGSAPAADDVTVVVLRRT